MADGHSLREAGARVEALLEELRANDDPRVPAAADEVARLLVELYGAGLERILEIGFESDGGEALLERLTADDLVSSLLILHDLHPLGVEDRIAAALEGVRPYLGSHAGGVEFLGVDDAGVAHLQLQGSCDGCASSALTVKLAIERAIVEAAPELTAIDVAGVAEPAKREPQLLQIQPLGGRDPEPGREGGWSRLEGLQPLLPGELRAVEADGLPVLLCSAKGGLYAYRNACAACGSALERGRLAGEELTCPGCGEGYDVRLAGRSLAGMGLHLDPLPLLSDSTGVRVALPGAVRA